MTVTSMRPMFQVSINFCNQAEVAVSAESKSHIKVRSPTSYQFFLSDSKNFPWNFHLLELSIGFQQCLAHLPSSWLVNQGILLSQPLDHLHLKDFLNYECKSYLKQPLTPPQHKFVATYRNLNHRVAIENGRWSTIPISRVENDVTLALTMYSSFLAIWAINN
jgi:hypothetical protein